MTRYLLILLLSTVLACAGSVPKSAARNGTGVSAQGDAAIENLIKTKLARSKIGADHFRIRVQGGIAYWDGTTNVIQHKGAATRMAKTAGAKAVVNHIQISDAARAKAAANLENGRRRAQIRRGDPRSEPRTEAVAR